MDMFRSKRSSSHHEQLDDGDRPAKRISTPAGQRLSMIIESHQSRRSKAPTAKINVTTTSTYCNDPEHQHIHPVHHVHKDPKKLGVVSVLTGGKLNTPRESIDERTPNGSALSVSVWSEKDNEKFGHVRHVKKRGFLAHWSRKRIAIAVAILLAFIIALAVGVAVGTKKKPASSISPSSTTTTNGAGPANNQASPTAGAASETDKPPTPASSLTPSALPSGFPLGTFSFITFLDTAQSDCTANAATWTCPPSTDYYVDPQKALTILNWEISGSPGAYKISSNGQDATFGTMFQNEKLELLDSGKDTERFRFQFNRAKVVNMTGTIGDEKGDFECDYGATNIQGSLYTKMARTYPQDTVVVKQTANPSWPFAARVEQTVAGGENVPSCKAKSGDTVTSGLKAQDASTLCSCLYKNWTPAKPYR